MTEPIIQLTAADYREATDFLANAFRGEITGWFRQYLATCYQPTDELMRCNYAIKRDGRIVAMAGAFPSVIHFGDHALKNAGIGGVGVSLDCRRQGLMKRIMAHITQVLRQSDVQVSYLGGQRQRYNYFGWERAGCEQSAQVTPSCINHHFAGQPCRVTLYPLDDDPRTLKTLHTLYQAQPLHCERPADQFHDFLTSWEMVPQVARNDDNRIVGYLACHPEKKTVNELVADTPDSAAQMLYAYGRQIDQPFDVYLPPIATEISRGIHAFAEVPGLTCGGNWQIFDWPATLTALLRLKFQTAPLVPGRVTLHLADLNQTLELSVTAGGAACTQTVNERPDLVIPSLLATQILTSPLQPSQIITLPQAAAILDAWCPLPLGIGRQDKV